MNGTVASLLKIAGTSCRSAFRYSLATVAAGVVPTGGAAAGSATGAGGGSAGTGVAL